jgi:ELWxxDGT repeat protein
MQIKALTPNVYWPSKLTALNGRLFFVLYDETHGGELWTSDGTGDGTMLLKDINPGDGSSYPASLEGVGDSLFFFADDGTHGKELWVSDGTEAGTALLKDINAGSDGSWDSYWAGNAGVSGWLFFAANDGTHGTELWISDGTEAGTVLVKDINPAGSGLPGFRANTNVVVDNTLVFAADDGLHGRELWQSDGTEVGTVLVQDINPGGAASYPDWLTLGEKIVAFEANDGMVGYELWALAVVDGVDGWIGAPAVRSGEPSEQVGISVSYGNLGATTTVSTTLTAALDPALAYITDTSGITPVVSGGTLLAWPLPGLDFLDEGRFKVTVQMPADDIGTCYPVAWILASDGPEADPENNRVQTEVCHFPWHGYLPLVLTTN